MIIYKNDFLRKSTINKIESERNRIMELKQTKFNIDCTSNHDKKERKKNSKKGVGRSGWKNHRKRKSV